MTGLAFSPHGGPIVARNELSSRFAPRLGESDTFSRKIVSYQGNRNAPGLRWMKYKEGFSSQLVAGLIQENRPSDVLDPFAGICTAPLVAAGQGINATGIEIMPVGISVGSSIAEAANGLSPVAFDRQSSALLRNVRTARAAKGSAFPHVRITEGAFSEKTERQISAARAFLSHMDDGGLKSLLDLACMSVLEEASYTRKDGQYLRWDSRSNRKLRSSFDVGPISDFGEALERRLREIATDIPALKKSFGKGYPTLLNGSCLEVLRTVPDGAFDMVVTSPPYANRYDYTRTYALELAWMGFDQEEFSALRQRMLSATVENRAKTESLDAIYGDGRETLDRAIRMYDEQGAVHEVLGILRDRRNELSNRNVLRLIEQYFLEMAITIAELGRIVRPGGSVFMVNDNVQYHGEELPVDFILSDFAEGSGFRCDRIWKLARGKGNSSQQMARFGRRELRKCVYKWVRNNDR